MFRSNLEEFAGLKQSPFHFSTEQNTAFAKCYSNIRVVRSITQFHGIRLSYDLVRSNCNTIVITWPIGRLPDLSHSGASCHQVINQQRLHHIWRRWVSVEWMESSQMVLPSHLGKGPYPHLKCHLPGYLCTFSSASSCQRTRCSGSPSRALEASEVREANCHTSFLLPWPLRPQWSLGQKHVPFFGTWPPHARGDREGSFRLPPTAVDCGGGAQRQCCRSAGHIISLRRPVWSFLTLSVDHRTVIIL